GQMFTDDAAVADLFVTKTQLIVGESDAPRVMSRLGLFQRTRVKRGRARLLAAGECETAVQPPERWQSGRGQRVADGVGRATESRRCVRDAVLEEPRLGEAGAHAEFVLARQRA